MQGYEVPFKSIYVPNFIFEGRDDEDEAIQVVVHWGEWGLLDGDVIGHSIVDYPEDRQY
ncbi:hypothetical protein [Acetivibrio saccincola]|jgi:hypothetical protein|uniref:hypothetical protein n=1 Tax=Acetivibrio saccincola TaxID=1677857 RepID=UPI00131D5A53|nr:hypothetical protein [Acetivibrio saccincola]